MCIYIYIYIFSNLLLIYVNVLHAVQILKTYFVSLRTVSDWVFVALINLFTACLLVPAASVTLIVLTDPFFNVKAFLFELYDILTLYFCSFYYTNITFQATDVIDELVRFCVAFVFSSLEWVWENVCTNTWLSQTIGSYVFNTSNSKDTFNLVIEEFFLFLYACVTSVTERIFYPQNFNTTAVNIMSMVFYIYEDMFVQILHIFGWDVVYYELKFEGLEHTIYLIIKETCCLIINFFRAIPYSNLLYSNIIDVVYSINIQDSLAIFCDKGGNTYSICDVVQELWNCIFYMTLTFIEWCIQFYWYFIKQLYNGLCFLANVLHHLKLMFYNVGVWIHGTFIVEFICMLLGLLDQYLIHSTHSYISNTYLYLQSCWYDGITFDGWYTLKKKIYLFFTHTLYLFGISVIDYIHNSLVADWITLFSINVIALIKVIIAFLILTIVIATVTLIERKVLSLVQRRVGPNYVGYKGRWQFIADACKLLFKHIYVLARINRLLFFIIPALILIVSYLFWVNLIWGPNIAICEIEYNLLVMGAVSGFFSYLLVLVGWVTNNKYAILASNRVIVMSLNLEILLNFFIISLVIISESFSFFQIVSLQNNYLWNILIFLPVLPIIMITFLIETGRIPFDLAEAESELVAGYTTEFGGFFFALFYLGEYFHLYCFAGVYTLCLFGGWL